MRGKKQTAEKGRGGLSLRDFPQTTNRADWRELTKSQEFGESAYLRTVAAAVVDTVQAPPAIVFLQALHDQIPTAFLFTESYAGNLVNIFHEIMILDT